MNFARILAAVVAAVCLVAGAVSAAGAALIPAGLAGFEGTVVLKAAENGTPARAERRQARHTGRQQQGRRGKGRSETKTPPRGTVDKNVRLGKGGQRRGNSHNYGVRGQSGKKAAPAANRSTSAPKNIVNRTGSANTPARSLSSSRPAGNRSVNSPAGNTVRESTGARQVTGSSRNRADRDRRSELAGHEPGRYRSGRERSAERAGRELRGNRSERERSTERAGRERSRSGLDSSSRAEHDRSSRAARERRNRRAERERRRSRAERERSTGRTGTDRSHESSER